MILVDTSVWIEILRDKSGKVVQVFRDKIGEDVCALTRFTQLELLQGSRNETEWKMLDHYLSTQYYIETSEDTWREAARIYFELRRRGTTITSPIDCCIAQIAVDSGAILLHRNEDFFKIAKIRPLRAERFD